MQESGTDSDAYVLEDRSDEERAKCYANKTCAPNQAICEHGVCLDTARFCDGVADCANDELNCPGPRTPNPCDQLKCSYNCRKTPQGPKCYCVPGLQPNGTDCVDVDECNDSHGLSLCDQRCENTPGSYKCSCVSGYQANGTQCVAINVPKDEPASLVLLTGYSMKRLRISDGQLWPNNPVIDLVSPVAIEMWHRNRSVCALSANLGGQLELRCYDIDDFSKSWLLVNAEKVFRWHQIQMIRLDWVTGNWYFLNKFNIFLCTPTLEYCSNILTGDSSSLRSMALDPTKGHLFFSTSSAIVKSSLDGIVKTTLVSTDVIYPEGVAADLPNEQIYWLDVFWNHVERVDYDGRNRRILKKNFHVS